MPAYIWQPIEPLSEVERRIDLAAMGALHDSWRAFRNRAQQSSSHHLDQFNERLVRRLSVETGILERLYDLDRGTTEALVAHGFAEELITRSSTNIEPGLLIELLRDQEAAIQLVMDCIARSRNLTKGLIHELHAVLTRHRETTTAVDQFGARLEIPLLRGAYNQHPNNPRRPDGSIHEYCPPVHVDSEMSNLLEWLSEYSKEDPIIVSAWLHHRFTQIHPYQDGNGRVARALTTMLLLRSDLLPLVVDRDLRVEYIGSLEAADLGDLAPLADTFARLERNAILEALSVDTDAGTALQPTVAATINSLGEKLKKRSEETVAELRNVNEIAKELRRSAIVFMKSSFAAVEAILSSATDTESFVDEGGSDHGNALWYKSEVVSSSNAAKKFANFSEDHYFVRATIRTQDEILNFVTSFHHVGRELSGVMEATAFAGLETYEGSEHRDWVVENFFPCSTAPFVFTYRTDPHDIQQAFDHWLDHAVAVALKQFSDRL